MAEKKTKFRKSLAAFKGILGGLGDLAEKTKQILPWATSLRQEPLGAAA